MRLKNFNWNYLNLTVSICYLFILNTKVSHAQDIEYVRNTIKILCSSNFKGRGYVENGDKKASAFIAKEFAKAGLVPLNKGSYFQNYNLSVNTFPGTVHVELDDLTLRTAEDYLINATSPSIKGEFKVILITRSQINKSLGLMELVNNAGNAFILLDNRPGSDETPDQVSAANSNIERLENDESLGFKGLIIYSEDKLTWTTSTYQSVRPVVRINKADLNLRSIKLININIEAKLIPSYQTRNVAGMIKGSTVPDSMLVVTAHYDHLGLMGKNTYFPGANDNASGTAMVLSLIKYYAIHKPKYTMVFIGFSGEEIGLLGSGAFIENPLVDLKRIKFLVNFDLAGTGEEGIRVVNGSIYKDKFEELVKINNKYKFIPNVDKRGESCNSDHCLFHKLGVPSFFIYTQGGIKAYHDIYDRAETLPLTEFEDYFKLMTKFLAAY